jgi:hypothetical protein
MNNLDIIIQEIDTEIERLQRVRDIMSPSLPTIQPINTKKRILSPEALERIRDGQRKRWANVRKAEQKGGEAQ